MKTKVFNLRKEAATTLITPKVTITLFLTNLVNEIL